MEGDGKIGIDVSEPYDGHLIRLKSPAVQADETLHLFPHDTAELLTQERLSWARFLINLQIKAQGCTNHRFERQFDRRLAFPRHDGALECGLAYVEHCKEIHRFLAALGPARGWRPALTWSTYDRIARFYRAKTCISSPAPTSSRTIHSSFRVEDTARQS